MTRKASKSPEPSVSELGKIDRPIATSFDVARRAGVSQSTVARVFRSPSLVSESTRERVADAAEALGYVPSAIAGGMRTQRSGLVGVVVPSTGEYWQGVISEFARQVSESSRQLLVTTFQDEQGAESAIRSISRYRLDGVVLASSSINLKQILQLSQTNTPVVVFNQPAASGLVATVSVDNQTSSALIAEHLLQRSVKSVVFVGGKSEASTDQLRYRGAAETFGARGVSCQYVEAGAFSYDAGFKIGSNAGIGKPLPDAFMVAADEIAFGVLDGLRKRGIKVPQDVFVTGFDGVPQSFWEGYDLTTLVQPIKLMVSNALHLLGNSRSQDAVVTEGELRLGNSTAGGLHG